MEKKGLEMSFDFGSMDELKTERKGGSGRGGPQPLNLPVRVQSFNIANSKAATPAKDSLVGILAVDAWDKKAGDEVTVKMVARPPSSDPDKVPQEIFTLQPRKYAGKREMGENPLVIFENAALQSDGTVLASWLKVAEYKYSENYDRDAFQAGYVSVGYLNEPTKVTDSDGTERESITQMRELHFIENAVALTGAEDEAIENFRQLAINFLTDQTENAGGSPGMLLRLVKTQGISDPEKKDFVSTVKLYLPWVDDAENPGKKRRLSPEEAVDNWLNDPNSGGKWQRYIRGADAINGMGSTIEAWPFWNYRTGKNQAKQQNDLRKSGKSHLAEIYSAPRIDNFGDVIKNERGSAETDYGCLVNGMHKVVSIEATESWMVDQTYALERYPSQMFTYRDVPTRNLAPEALEHFNELGRKRRTLQREMKKTNTAEHKSEGNQDFGGDEGAPDPTGGLRPRS